MKFYFQIITIITTFVISSCASSKTIINTHPKIDSKALLSDQTMKKYMNTITAEELKEHLYIFASDAFEGRETGTRGQKMAANYLSDAYHSLHLKGPVNKQANPYLQRIPFLEEKTTFGTIKHKDIQIDNGTDFLTQGLS